jgi:Glycosyltransferase family 28 C-terminal domain
MNSVVYASDWKHEPDSLEAFLAIERELRAHGASTTYVTPAAHQGFDRCRDAANKHGIAHLSSPRAPLAPAGYSHLHMLRACSSMASSANLAHVLNFWTRLYEDEAPDLVVTDSSIPALLAARLVGIPAAVADFGFFAPDLSADKTDFDTPALQRPAAMDAARLSRNESHLLDVANDALAALGGRPVRSWQQLFECDRIVRLTTPAISALPGLPESSYLGLMPTRRRNVPSACFPLDRRRPKVVALLHPSVPASHPLLRVLLANTDWDLGLNMPGGPQLADPRLHAAHVSWLSEREDLLAAIATSDLLICHGEHGFLAQATLSGTPMLLVPATIEQLLRARMACNGGRARLLAWQEASEPSIERELRAVLADPTYTARARQAQRTARIAPEGQVGSQLLGCAAPDSRHATATAPRGSMARTRRFKTSELDTVFLSFDEPNADAHWQRLSARIPTAKRVDRVAGFNASHKAAADVAETERFIIVDADNVVDDDFFLIDEAVPAYLEQAVWTWTSRNRINGLVYPYGGVKIWTKEIVHSMRTHECASSGAGLKLDFWDQPGYYAFRRCFSLNDTAGSELQAFRSGFREGIKLTRWNGIVKTPDDLKKLSGTIQFKRLVSWMVLGGDAPNGAWSMLGARMGCHAALSSAFNVELINDYAWFDAHWRRVHAETVDATGHADQGLAVQLASIGSELASVSDLLAFEELSAAQSEGIKARMQARRRTEHTHLFDIFGIYDEL